MFLKTIQIDLSKRITAYYLLFCALTFAFLFAGAVLSLRGYIRDRIENSGRHLLQRTASSIELDYLRNEGSQVQSIVERLQREEGLAYCSVVGTDGRVIAHNESAKIGQSAIEPPAVPIQTGNVALLRYTDARSRQFDEFRVGLKPRGKPVGDLRIATQEPDLWNVLKTAIDYFPTLLVLPIITVICGAVVLKRLVTPIDQVDRQLRKLLQSDVVQDVTLEPVRANSAGTLGWNRLAAARQAPAKDSESTDSVASHALQARWKAILSSMAEGIAVTDGNGVIVYANRAFSSLLAIKDSVESESLHKVLLKYASETDGIQTLFSEDTFHPLVSNVTLPGERTLRLARCSLTADDDTTMSGHVWVIRDVTQQLLAEKMRDQFLDSATHELRTPLANIRAFAETLASNEVVDVEQQKEFCNTINTEAKRLGRFIEDLLNISSLEAGSLTVTRQRVETDKLLRESAEKTSGLMEQKEIDFQVTLPEKLPELQLDKDKLSTTMVNLLGNAAKYTEPRGKVELRARVTERWLEVDVVDSGVGIAANEVSHVFDKFFRSDDQRVRQQVGTGLGLSLAKQVVELHGGTLTVQSELNVGSTFTVRLPLKLR